jgi:general secretion pathway protein N
MGIATEEIVRPNRGYPPCRRGRGQKLSLNGQTKILSRTERPNALLMPGSACNQAAAGAVLSVVWWKMDMRRSFLCVGLLAGLIVLVVPAAPSYAATSTLDSPPNEIGNPTTPLAVPRRGPSNAPVLSGNPLWPIPLSTLSATRDRPIFSPSRRPPPVAAIGPRIEPTRAPPPVTPEPPRPSLALIGVVVGASDALAIFLDQASKGTVRMRPGQEHQGWVLSTVVGREATLQKGSKTEVFALPSPSEATPDVPAPLSAAGTPPVIFSPVMPLAGDTAFTPFSPRSTPKNGESDGL